MSEHFEVIAYFDGYFDGGIDEEFEKRLSKSVGKRDSGAGTCFLTSERDISWSFRNEKDAQKAVNKLKRFSRIKRIDLDVHEVKKDKATGIVAGNYKRNEIFRKK